jgi:benzodiazapine receptor
MSAISPQLSQQDAMPRLLRSLALPGITAAIGSASTAKNVNSWFPKLDQPSWAPPNSAFGPVWTTLYIMMGVADFLVASEGDSEQHRNARRIYHIQLGLNGLWSVIFFGFRAPGFALIEIVGLWAAIALTIRTFWPISRPAALLLVPYLLWTTFATALNASIWWKNR